MTVRQLGRRLQTHQISCLELFQETMASIQAKDHFNAFISHAGPAEIDEAMALDSELMRGESRGPLHGIPIAHKDLFYTRGVKTTGGSPIFKDFVPDFDGDVVANLKAAGAICTGKTNLHELAYGITCNNPHHGPVLNPHETRRIPGGSSGGSAALIAAGLLPLATGTDTGGSIRIPASYCGIVGLKPTYDLVSRRGILPLNYGLDHAGPLGSCVEDCALALNAMVGRNENFNLESFSTLRGLRIGIPSTFFFDRVQAEIEDAIRSRVSEMQRQGAAVVTTELPDFQHVNAAARVVQMSEAAALYVNYQDPALFGKDVWTNLQDGRQILAHEYVNAQRLRSIYRQAMDQIWSTVDIIITPTTAITAPLRDTLTVEINGQPEDIRLASTRLVRGWNFLGEPAMSIPCGKDTLNLPIGMQLIAAPYADARLLQIGKTLEQLWV